MKRLLLSLLLLAGFAQADTAYWFGVVLLKNWTPCAPGDSCSVALYSPPYGVEGHVSSSKTSVKASGTCVYMNPCGQEIKPYAIISTGEIYPGGCYGDTTMMASATVTRDGLGFAKNLETWATGSTTYPAPFGTVLNPAGWKVTCYDYVSMSLPGGILEERTFTGSPETDCAGMVTGSFQTY